MCLCCPVYVAALRRADHSSEEPYRCKIKEPRKRRPMPDMDCKRHWMDGWSYTECVQQIKSLLRKYESVTVISLIEDPGVVVIT
jgi:hypothetical protein